MHLDKMRNHHKSCYIESTSTQLKVKYFNAPMHCISIILIRVSFRSQALPGGFTVRQPSIVHGRNRPITIAVPTPASGWLACARSLEARVLCRGTVMQTWPVSSGTGERPGINERSFLGSQDYARSYA